MTPEECRRRRMARGLTPESLALLAGLAERTVLRFEGRNVESRYGTILALTRARDRADLAALEHTLAP